MRRIGVFRTTSRNGRVLAMVAVLGALSIGGCADRNRAILAPPLIPGAEFAGSVACADCHEDVTRNFDSAVHSVLVANGENAQAQGIGCEGCHGPGSLHIESGGEDGTIVSPRRSSETCYQCHVNKRGDFSLPYAHPVSTGPLNLTTAKMACADCHSMHEGDAVVGGGTSIQKQNDLCTSCHPAQRGPFVFEHEAMREGCISCHDPHGSVNQKMLVSRDASLCLKCHTQQQSPSATTTFLIGGRDHSSFLTRGTCFSAGCHESIHGSNVSASMRF
ncbi:MAG: cytochrome c3 family protein [Candidatus Binatia bacterium]